MDVQTVYGVDFSGAKLAGRNIWVARCDARRGRKLRLVELRSLEAMCGTAARDPALAALVGAIKGSESALWGMDFPFGLPVEVMDDGCAWLGQLQLLAEWRGDAYDLGLRCVERARLLGPSMHIRRTTDTEMRTPFDCYHYRIIYQTFHGMRDVLAPLATHRGTVVLPFQYHRLARATRVVVEGCPGSTLKRMGLPHNNYKQPTGGPLTRVRRQTRHRIVAGLAPHVAIAPADLRKLMRNPGGDAIDAVIAAVGAWWAWRNVNHDVIRKHVRYGREGYLFS